MPVAAGIHFQRPAALKHLDGAAQHVGGDGVDFIKYHNIKDAEVNRWAVSVLRHPAGQLVRRDDGHIVWHVK